MTGVALNDDAALALVSHAVQERLKYLIEQMKLIAEHRIDLSMKVTQLDRRIVVRHGSPCFRTILPISRRVM